MSTVFPDADAVPVEPPADDEEPPLEQPTAAIAAIATAASAGVSLLPFKVCFPLVDWIIRLPALDKHPERQFGIKCEPRAAWGIPKGRPAAPGCRNARL
jgi:hypothetical protein